MLGGGGGAGPAFGPAPFLLGGGGGSKRSAPLFPGPQGEPAHGLHPRFVVAEIWADRGSRGGGGGAVTHNHQTQSCRNVSQAQRSLPASSCRVLGARGGFSGIMEHRHWHFKFPLSHHLFLSRCLSAPSRCISVCLVSSNLVQSSLVHVLIHRKGGGG